MILIALGAKAGEWRILVEHDITATDSIGIGYLEQLGERSADISTNKQFQALHGTLETDFRAGVLNRTVSGYEPHFKEEIKLRTFFREQSNRMFTYSWMLDGESFRDRQIAPIVQRGSAGANIIGYTLDDAAQFSSGSDVVQRRGRMLAGGEINTSHLAMALHGGMSYDEDLKDIGSGPAMQFEFRSDSLALAEWHMISEAGYRHSWLRPREDAKGIAKFSITRRYGEATALVDATVDHSLRDVVGTVPLRRNDWHGLGLAMLQFPAPGHGTWRLNADWEGSQVKQGNTLPSSSQLRHEYQLEWAGSNVERFLTTSYRIGYQTSKSGKQIQNDQSESVMLNTGLTNMNDDTLQLIIQGTATRTETPDSLDYNDRDELRWRLQLNGVYQAFPGIWVIGDCNAVLMHSAYFSSHMSASNRHTNTYQLGGSVYQLFHHGFHRFRTEISATYVLFDFKLASQPARDVLSRRLSFYDSAAVPVGVGLIEWQCRTDLEDRGAFDRDRSEQSLSEAIQTVVGTIRYRIPFHQVGVAVGLAAYKRQPYRYEHRTNSTVKIADIAVAGLGPSMIVERSPGNRWHLFGEATLLYVSQSPRGRYMQNSVSITLSRSW